MDTLGCVKCFGIFAAFLLQGALAQVTLTREPAGPFVEGTTVKFSCAITGFVNFDVAEWEHISGDTIVEIGTNLDMNTDFNSGDRYTFEADMENFGTFFLTVTGFKTEDAATFKCSHKGKGQSDEIDMSDNALSVSPTSASFKVDGIEVTGTTMINVTGVEGTTMPVQITCDVMGGLPAPVVTIMRDDVDITADFTPTTLLEEVKLDDAQPATFLKRSVRRTMTGTIELERTSGRDSIKCVGKDGNEIIKEGVDKTIVIERVFGATTTTTAEPTPPGVPDDAGFTNCPNGRKEIAKYYDELVIGVEFDTKSAHLEADDYSVYVIFPTGDSRHEFTDDFESDKVPEDEDKVLDMYFNVTNKLEAGDSAGQYKLSQTIADGKINIQLEVENARPQTFRPYQFVVEVEDNKFDDCVIFLEPAEGSQPSSGDFLGASLILLAVFAAVAMVTK